MDNSFAAVVADLEFLSQDNALLNAALYKNPSFVAWCERIVERQHRVTASSVTPMPALGKIMALEATLFDNGDGPRFRHRITVKVHTGSAPKWTRPNWQATATLWPHDVALKTAKKSKAKLSEETMTVIDTFAGQGHGFVGIFMHSGAGVGSAYNDAHVVWVDVENCRAMIYTPTDHFWLAPFDTFDAKGKPLKGNAFLHSRNSADPAMDHWATGEPVSL